MKILVTGSAGFIGSSVSMSLLEKGHHVVGLDNLNNYYDVRLKEARLNRFRHHQRYTHFHADLADRHEVERIFDLENPRYVIHLAAQAGVRYAAINPHLYVASNVTGFLHILEGCRSHRVDHLIFASTSSVYGANTTLPFSEHRGTEHPLTLYAATKKANEMMAHSYAHLYKVPCTGLRFFTVYGPWGRPDMALFLFTKAILAGEPIQIFNDGHHKRAFTFIDDIVESLTRLVDKPPAPDPGWDSRASDPATSAAPYRIFNVGSDQSVDLLRYIEVLEECLGRKAIREFLPLQAGDVPETDADISDLENKIGFKPQTTIEVGVARFVAWYREYFHQ